MIEINKTISTEKLNACEYFSSFGVYNIYKLDEYTEYIFAIDSNNLICSCFEFVEQEDGYLLAHMHTIENLKGLGLGTQILKEAIIVYDSFDFPSNTNDTYYYIEDGYDWIQRRFNDSTLTSPKFIRP